MVGRDRVLVNRDRGSYAATAGWLNSVGSLSAGAALGDAAARWSAVWWPRARFVLLLLSSG